MAGNNSIKLSKKASKRITRPKKKSKENTDLNESIICVEDEEQKKLSRTPMTRQRSRELSKIAAKRKISTSSNLHTKSSKNEFNVKSLLNKYFNNVYNILVRFVFFSS